MKRIGSRRPHLLYVAFAFPPSTASSVYRCLAVPNEFAAAGWDVTVLTIDGDIWSEVSGADDGLLESVDERINVVRIGDGGSEEPARGDLRRFTNLRVNAPFVWQKVLTWRSLRSFPETYHGLWLNEARKAVRSIHAERGVDLTMASASPYVSFEIARSVAGVPYVMDYRDAWAFHTFSGKENFSPESRTGRLEASLLRGATQVWFVNEQILEEYGLRYPFARDRMRVVPNGFDPQPGHRIPDMLPVERPTFGYLGTIPHVNTPLEAFFAGWKKAFGVTEGVSEPAARAVIRGKLSSSGRVSAEVLRSFETMKSHGLEYQGPLPKREVAGFYQSLDALVLLLPGGRYVTGGKTAEYLATGLPIVSVHDLSNATSDLLRDYPLWFPAQSLTEDGISRALKAAATFLRTPDRRRADAAWEYGQRFARSRTLRPVIAELTDVVGFSANPDGPHDAQSCTRSSVPRRTSTTSTIERQYGAHGRVLRVGVIATDQATVSALTEQLNSRFSPTVGSGLDVWSAYAGASESSSVQLPAISVHPMLAAGLALLARSGGPLGSLARLLERNIVSRIFARAVLNCADIRSRIQDSDVVLAGDEIAIRAVWQLRSRTQAELVYGPAALIHACRKATGT